MTNQITGADFRYPFRFENQVKAGNTSGGQSESSTEFVNLRGLWVKKDGSRQMNSDMPGYDQIITVYDAYSYWRQQLEDFITKDSRLIYDNKEYRIESYERIGERRQYMHFTVSEAH